MPNQRASWRILLATLAAFAMGLVGTARAQGVLLPLDFALPVATANWADTVVAPVLVGIFGPMPLAALPANVLAGPASGAVMIWGCTGGLLAGILGGTAAELLHLPTRALLWWIGGVATT